MYSKRVTISIWLLAFVHRLNPITETQSLRIDDNDNRFLASFKVNSWIYQCVGNITDQLK